jgi:hypothetical protein
MIIKTQYCCLKSFKLLVFLKLIYNELFGDVRHDDTIRPFNVFNNTFYLRLVTRLNFAPLLLCVLVSLHRFVRFEKTFTTPAGLDSQAPSIDKG